MLDFSAHGIKSGIYTISIDGKIVYVGKSSDSWNRANQPKTWDGLAPLNFNNSARTASTDRIFGKFLGLAPIHQKPNRIISINMIDVIS